MRMTKTIIISAYCLTLTRSGIKALVSDDYTFSDSDPYSVGLVARKRAWPLQPLLR